MFNAWQLNVPRCRKTLRPKVVRKAIYHSFPLESSRSRFGNSQISRNRERKGERVRVRARQRERECIFAVHVKRNLWFTHRLVSGTIVEIWIYILHMTMQEWEKLSCVGEKQRNWKNANRHNWKYFIARIIEFHIDRVKAKCSWDGMCSTRFSFTIITLHTVWWPQFQWQRECEREKIKFDCKRVTKHCIYIR